MERAPISAALRLGWIFVFLASIVEGFVAIAMLGALCEDVGSAGSDRYCRHGGMDARGSRFSLRWRGRLSCP